MCPSPPSPSRSHHPTASLPRPGRRFPYLYTVAMEARSSGLPMLRHHLLHFPDDPRAWRENYQFSFGPALLVAPVVVEGATRQTVYLPQGRVSDGGAAGNESLVQWIDVSSHLAYDEEDGRHRIGYAPLLDGGQSVEVAAPLDTCPLFVRAGTILATLDPTVDTLNPAAYPGVTSYEDRKGVLYLWAWPDAGLRAGSGKLWDGSAFTLQPAATAEELSGPVIFAASDTADQRTLIAQIAVPAAFRRTLQVEIEQSGTPVQRVADWRALVHADNEESCYAVDTEKGTIWLRLSPQDKAVRITPV
jgi:hypothetical protein